MSTANWQDLIISDDDKQVKELLSHSRIIAVVGMKAQTYKASYYVPKYMLDHGYEIIPVNPHLDQIEDLICYPDLHKLPKKADIVQVFRRPSEVLPHAQEAAAIKPQAFWMQSGIINEEAAELLAKAGIKVVMDRCMYVDHMNFFGGR